MKDDTTSDNAANLRPMRLRKLGGWIGIVYSLPVFFMFLVHFSGVLNPRPEGIKLFDDSGTLIYDTSVLSLYNVTSMDYLRLLYAEAGGAIVLLLLILLAPPPRNKKMKFLLRFCAALQVAVLIGTVAAMAIVKL